MTDDVELSDEQRRALAALKRDAAPPDVAERRLLATLRATGLIQGRRLVRWLVVAAALLAAFGAGAASQHQSADQGSRGTPRFALLLYGGAAGGPDSVDRRAEYAAWARAQAARGIAIDGEELDDAHIDLPESYAAAPPRGFFIISAASVDEARRIAASCPHLQHGGAIVIRPIVESPTRRAVAP